MPPPPQDFTPRASGPHRRHKPVVSAGLLALIALIGIIVILILTIWLVPPLLY